MTRDETVALFLQGREAWNAWAEGLLTERKALEAAGTWKSRRNYSYTPEKGENPETQAWLDTAFADFSRCLFLVREIEGPPQTAGEEKKENKDGGPPVKSIQLEADRIDFDGFVFPGDAWFYNATFIGDAWFNSATFTGYAYFESATFTGDARFASATFTGDARFASAIFIGTANFRIATFSGDARGHILAKSAWFMFLFFTGRLRFAFFSRRIRSFFNRPIRFADFESATFTGNAYFESATFTGNASFNSATFTGGAWFNSARFRRTAYFRDIKPQRAFSLIGARFRRRVPDFLSAKFAEPVLLDNVQLATGIEPGGLLRSVLGPASGLIDTALSAKYRALKRLAIQSDDHRNEQIFFRGELRARRYNEDKPWHPAFWFGILYELVSDFGHSISKPLLWLIAVSLISSWFYLGQHTAADGSPRAQLQARIVSHLPDSVRALLFNAQLQARIVAHLPDRVLALLPAARAEALPALSCKHGDGDPVRAAVLVAVRQSSVIGAFDSSKSTQIYACLYGYDETLRRRWCPTMWCSGASARRR